MKRLGIRWLVMVDFQVVTANSDVLQESEY